MFVSFLDWEPTQGLFTIFSYIFVSTRVTAQHESVSLPTIIIKFFTSGSPKIIYNDLLVL